MEIVPRLTEYGKIAEEQLWMLESRFPTVKIDQYVIMPDHIHLLLILKDFMSLEDRCKQAAGASPRPTSTGEVTDPQHPLPNLIRVIGTYKSLTTRACKNYRPIDKLFQSSFYEHVIRGPQDYEEMIRYIQNNPAKWYYDRMTDI